MDRDLILSLCKDRIGIRSDVRDVYIRAIIDGVISEVSDEKGIVLKTESAHHLMFVVDLSVWRYLNRDHDGPMPRHLQFRLHNLMIKEAGVIADDV